MEGSALLTIAWLYREFQEGALIPFSGDFIDIRHGDSADEYGVWQYRKGSSNRPRLARKLKRHKETW